MDGVSPFSSCGSTPFLEFADGPLEFMVWMTEHPRGSASWIEESSVPDFRVLVGRDRLLPVCRHGEAGVEGVRGGCYEKEAGVIDPK